MIRKATIADAKNIHTLIQSCAKKGKILERSLNNIYENIRAFWVYEDKTKIVACCALGIVGWQNLGEIRSLVVAPKFRHKGIGANLVKKCIEEAKGLSIKGIFTLTFIPSFFKKLGFKTIDKKELPHKIWSDCINCVYFPDCEEQAMILKIK
ncbi:MAG: N-acetyltransferase [Candidatus Omnitrophota bacterium]|nr:MAG: N-acetyltransferase [Candidatus Omnitrophota bacterium]